MKLNDLNASYCKLSTSNHIQQTNSNEKTTVNPPPKTPKTPPTCAWGAVTCCDVCFQSVPFFLRWLLRLNFAVHRFYMVLPRYFSFLS